MLNRSKYLQDLETATRRSPITALLGPRQVGKTTLARLFTANRQRPSLIWNRCPISADCKTPNLCLGSLQGLVVLDEIQQMPELFSTLRVLVDRPDNQARFIILGSASPQLIRQCI